MYIRLKFDPYPSSKKPQFVQAAYEGLVVEVYSSHLTSSNPLFPEGFYFITLDELLAKMEFHNPEAYEWLNEEWGPIADRLPAEAVLQPFPTTCCDIFYGTVH